MTVWRTGDAGVVLAGLAAVIALGAHAWSRGPAERAIVRAAGSIVETPALTRAHTVSVKGPLGMTLIEIEPGRARIARDPSPRQLCVRQGWLSQAGDTALCLPNQVSLEIRGRDTLHDTLAY